MNLVGKIFVIVVFLLSVVFATFSMSVYMTFKNWRNVVIDPTNGLEQQLTAARAKNKELTDKRKALEEELQNEKTRYAKVLAQLENENDALQKERVENQKKDIELQAQVRDSVKAVDDIHEKQLTKLHGEAETLRQSIATAQANRKTKFGEVIRLTDEVHNAVNERMRLERYYAELYQEKARLQQMR